jgi:CheY-like chemotaxis protein
MQVLVVDDEIAIVNLLAEVLSDEGHAVEKAHDGRSALAMLRAGLRPQVIVTDVMMPNLDGLGLYHAIRNEFSGEQIGMVLVSAGKKIRLNDPNAVFVSKPFGVMDIIEAVERLM